MATPARFERTTCFLGGSRSIQLSYGAFGGNYRKFRGVRPIRSPRRAPRPAYNRRLSQTPIPEIPLQITMYRTAFTTTTRALRNLDAILDKTAASAEARKIDPAVLLQSRLAPDMFPLLRQVQIASDFCKGPLARLSGMENPRHEDNESTIPELKARLAKALAFVNSVPESALDGCEDRDLKIPAGPDRTLEFKGIDYLLGFAIPNLNFHLAMAYAILRHNGVEIGKSDYIGAA